MDRKISSSFWEITEMISRGRVLGPTALGSKLAESDSTGKPHIFKVNFYSVRVRVSVWTEDAAQPRR